METKLEIAINWLPRYTGMPLDKFGDYILITNFKDYVDKFAERFSVEIYGEGRAMQAATNSDGLTIINYGIGSPNAATLQTIIFLPKYLRSHRLNYINLFQILLLIKEVVIELALFLLRIEGFGSMISNLRKDLS